MLRSRWLSEKTDKRRPSEQAALDKWLALTQDIARRALLTAEAPPRLEVQIADVDDVMLQTFDSSTAFAKEDDLEYLTQRAVSSLQKRWSQIRATKPVVSLAGSCPLPVFESTSKQLAFDYLR